MKTRKYTTIVVLAIIGLFKLGDSNGQKLVRINPDTLVYKQIDTTSLEIYAYYPLDFSIEKEYSAIVFFHGGGWNKGKPKAFNRQAMYLASRGMVAFSVQYRVRDFNGTTPFDAVEDAKSAIRYVRANANEFKINPNMIAAGGGSAGGHIAAAAGNIEDLEPKGEDFSISSKPDALILFNPVFDNSKEGYGYRRMEGRYEEISPLHNITSGAPPTIVFLGTKDKLIPVAAAEDYKTKMENVGSRCDLHLYEGQEHAFFGKKPIKYFIETIYQADLFLKSLGYLAGEPTIYKQYSYKK